MTTLNLQVNTSAGDAHAGSINNDSGRSVTSGANISSLTDNPLSPGSHGSNNEHTAAFRFTSVTIANAMRITSATFILTAQATYDAGANVVSFLVSAEASDNAPALVDTGAGELLTSTARPRTTAVSAAWNQTSVTADTEYSIDITSVIQEIVDRAGWASGNAILILVDTNTTTTLNEWQDYYSYDGSTTKAAKLDIVYSSGLSATANQTTETDTAQAVGKLKSLATGQPSETDTAQALARLKTAAIGQLTETGTTQAITAVKTVAVGQVSETDTAQPLARLKTLAVGQIEETDTAQPVGGVKVLAIGQVGETDAGQAIGRLKTVAVGQAEEGDTAQSVTPTGGISQGIGQATETDSPQAIARLKTLAIGQASEVDLAISMVVIAGAVAIYAASLNSNPSPAGTLNSNPSPVTTRQGNPSPVASLNSNPSPVGELDSNPSPVEELVIG